MLILIWLLVWWLCGFPSVYFWNGWTVCLAIAIVITILDERL